MKIFKLFISLSLILSISLLNSFAAISVSDGSAFVTKAEFAADLNNLSNRMSTLENSLDAKIDSLVSSYLSRNGIWNGETVNTLTGEYSSVKTETVIVNELPKSGLLMLPYFIHIDYNVGLYMSNQGSAAADSTNMALGSPAYHSITITLNLYEKSQSSSLSYTDVFQYALTGVFGRSSDSKFRMKLDIEPSQTRFLFVTKGSKLSYKLQTVVIISMDWWAFKHQISENEKTLTGVAATSTNGAQASFNSSSKYAIKFKTDGKISIY